MKAVYLYFLLPDAHLQLQYLPSNGKASILRLLAKSTLTAPGVLDFADSCHLNHIHFNKCCPGECLSIYSWYGYPCKSCFLFCLGFHSSSIGCLGEAPWGIESCHQEWLRGGKDRITRGVKAVCLFPWSFHSPFTGHLVNIHKTSKVAAGNGSEEEKVKL